MYAIVYIHTTNKQIYPMAKKYTKKEKVLVLKHDVILGSTYELVEVESDVTQYMGGGEAMLYEASVVIPIGKPDKNGDVMTQETIEQSLGSNNTFPIEINGHTIGDEKVAVVKKHRSNNKTTGKNKA